jgi:multidrug resistance protein, MATE family
LSDGSQFDAQARAKWRADLRDMARLAAPIVCINIGLQSMGVVDTLMVGRLGGEAIAAVALGNFYFFNVCVFGLGLLCALDPVIAQAVGAGDKEGVARGLQRGIVMAVLVSVAAMATMMPVESVLRALDQPEAVIGETAAYVRRRALGVLPYFLFNVFRQTLQAIGPVGPVLFAVVAANVVNAFANWVFIHGNLGAPALGVPGSGYATALAMWTMAPLLLYFAWPLLRDSLRPWRAETLRLAPIGRMLRLGAPIGTQWFFESFAFGLTALFMGWLGTVSLAGHEIALNMAALTFMVPLGISGAAAAVVGRAIGRGDMIAARRDAATAIICGVGFMCISAIVFISAPFWLATRYTTAGGDERRVARHGRHARAGNPARRRVLGHRHPPWRMAGIRHPTSRTRLLVGPGGGPRRGGVVAIVARDAAAQGRHHEGTYRRALTNASFVAVVAEYVDAKTHGSLAPITATEKHILAADYAETARITRI